MSTGSYASTRSYANAVRAEEGAGASFRVGAAHTSLGPPAGGPESAGWLQAPASRIRSGAAERMSMRSPDRDRVSNRGFGRCRPTGRVPALALRRLTRVELFRVRHFVGSWADSAIRVPGLG